MRTFKVYLHLHTGAVSNVLDGRLRERKNGKATLRSLCVLRTCQNFSPYGCFVPTLASMGGNRIRT